MSARRETRISSLKILVGALAIVPLRLPIFARALAVPFVLYLAFDSVWLLQSALDLYARFPWWLFSLTELIDLVLYTITAVTTHRIILLGGSSIPRYGIQWTRDTTRFFTLALLLTSASYATVFVLREGFRAIGRLDNLFLFGVAGVFGIWVLAFVVARLLLVFPAAAVGQPISLLHSWELTRHRKLLMLLITMVFPALIGLPAMVISGSSTVGYFLRSIISLSALVVTVILLSFAYQQIRKERTLP